MKHTAERHIPAIVVSLFTVGLLYWFPMPRAFSSEAEGTDAEALLFAYQEFATVPPFRNRSGDARSTELIRRCQRLNRECLEFIQSNRTNLRRASPDNPEYWRQYGWLIENGALPVALNDSLTIPDYRQLMDATYAWLYREIIRNGAADAARLHSHLSAHRRRAALAHNLLDRMVFVATTGILLPAINVHMAHRQSPAAPDGQRALDGLLQPLTTAERSLRRTLEGERRHVAAVMQQHSEPNAVALLDEYGRVHAFVAMRSEVDEAAFWQGGVDVEGNVSTPSDPDNLGAGFWHYYAANVRYTDISLTVLRALREIYEGRSSPGVPGAQPPAGWAWNWKTPSQELCLHPVDIHRTVALQSNLEFCHTWFAQPVITTTVAIPHSSDQTASGGHR
jgi:hypothetical protein